LITLLTTLPEGVKEGLEKRIGPEVAAEEQDLRDLGWTRSLIPFLLLLNVFK
jgi:hypothetical protein